MSVITLLFFFVLFLSIWLSVKIKSFFIIKTLFQIPHVFVLLYKDKLKVQHESATSLLCTNMLHFYVAHFQGRSLVTTFNLGYTWYLVKDFLHDQSTISDSSEDVKQNKTMKLSVLKSATCEPCLQSRMLHCIVTFLIIYTYKQTNSCLTASKYVKVSLVFIITNKLNADQALIQIKSSEKVQHKDSAQRILLTCN